MKRHTTTVDGNHVVALGHYGLTMVLVDPNPHELHPSLLIMTLLSWPRPLSDLNVILEGYYHFIVVVVITTIVVNVPWLWSSAES